MQQGFKNSFSISSSCLPPPKQWQRYYVNLKHAGYNIFMLEMLPLYRGLGMRVIKSVLKLLVEFICHLAKDAFLGKIGESVKYILS